MTMRDGTGKELVAEGNNVHRMRLVNQPQRLRVRSTMPVEE